MAFINSAISMLQTLVIALGAGLGVWGLINLLEGYGNDNPGAKSQGIKQFVAGGGEEEDVTPLVSAKREAFEEAAIPFVARFTQLETTSSISTEHFPKARQIWGESCLVIPEYCFAAELTGKNIQLSDEHTQFDWVDYDTAMQRLQYDSNKVALWELDNKIKSSVLV